MVDFVKMRKDELKQKSEFYKESIKKEYSQKFKDSSGIIKFLLFGGGTLAVVFFSDRIIKSYERKRLVVKSRGVPVKNEIIQNEKRGAKIILKDKAAVIILEIFRQLILAFLEKLKPANAKQDL